MPWWDTGYEGKKNPPRKGKLKRWWLKKGTEGVATFVDDDTKPTVFEVGEERIKLTLPFLYWEHQLYINGNWFNYFTCTAVRDDDGTPQEGTCVLCNSGDRSAQVAAYTVVSHTAWTDQQGNEHKDELMLFAPKTFTSAVAKLEKESAKRKGLRGCKYEIGRLGQQASNCGDDFSFEGRVELPDDVQPLNYLELLAPGTDEEYEILVGATAAEETRPIKY